MDKILFLDFDGVLFDTVDEAYRVCVHTKKFGNAVLPPQSLSLFRKYRPAVGPAWNYYFVMNAIINEESLKSICFEYTDAAKEFEEDFFETRKKLKGDNYKNWLRLNKKYSFLEELDKIVDITLQVYVITTKDKQTVEDLLKEYGINFIGGESILGKEQFHTYGSKKEIILNILSQKRYKAIFIDDLYSHLQPCEEIKNLQLIQAEWGYIDENNRSEYLNDMDKTLSSISKLKEIRQ
jgi:hypothetical protein